MNHILLNWVTGLLSSAVIHFDESNSTTGLHSIEDGTFTAYPNPFSDRLILDGLQGKEKIEIRDALGRLVHAKFEINGEVKLPELARGIYFLRSKNHIMRLVKVD